MGAQVGEGTLRDMGRQIGAAFQLGQDQKYADISAEFGRGATSAVRFRDQSELSTCAVKVSMSLSSFTTTCPRGPSRSSRAVVALATA